MLYWASLLVTCLRTEHQDCILHLPFEPWYLCTSKSEVLLPFAVAIPVIVTGAGKIGKTNYKSFVPSCY